MSSLKKHNYKFNIENPKVDNNKSYTELEVKNNKVDDEDLPLYFGCIPYVVLIVVMYWFYEILNWLLFNCIKIN